MTHDILADFMADRLSRLTRLFSYYLTHSNCEAADLQASICYALSHNGKYLRPLLVYAAGDIFNVSCENLDAQACAVELIHTYSLIHDDLPAMDNADLRRGKPSCHKAFNEALAILAGDALQPLAFEILATHPAQLAAEQRLAMISVLSQASGVHGMVAGQALDIAGVHSLEGLERMYLLKTGALFSASIQLGALAATESNAADLLLSFARHVGLAFQIQDDLLDIQSHPEKIGKPTGLDKINQKITYPILMGIEASQQKIHALLSEANAQLSQLDRQGKQTDLLRGLIHYIFSDVYIPSNKEI